MLMSALLQALRFKSTEHYEQLGYDENAITSVTVAARNPGTWANDIKVAIIDSKADQILTGVTTTGISVGMGITANCYWNLLFRSFRC